MDFQFNSRRLQELYTKEKDANKYSEAVVDAFFEVMAIIHAARDERDFYALRGLRYEKLVGNRAGQRSLRLNDQWRLVLRLALDDGRQYIQIVDIEDYH